MFAAAVLVCEHFLTERGLNVSERWNYAIGLVTDMGIIIAWAAVRQITVTPLIAFAMLTAAALAGIPDFLILQHEDQKQQREEAARRAREEAQRQAQWQRFAAENRKLAGQLALMQITGNGDHQYDKKYTRLHDLIESAGFVIGETKQSLENMEILASQLVPLMETLLAGQETE